MSKISNRFATKLKNPINALQKIVVLQAKGDFAGAMHEFNQDFLKNVSTFSYEKASVKRIDLFRNLMQDSRICSTFKLMLHDHLAEQLSNYFIEDPSNLAKIPTPVNFYYFKFELANPETLALQTEQDASISKNVNADKYANPAAPCFVLPIAGYYDFEYALDDLPGACLKELKMQLSALVPYEQWNNLKSPQWLAPDNVAEVKRIINEVTVKYTSHSGLPEELNAQYISDVDDQPETVGYLVIAPEFDFEAVIDPSNNPETREHVVPHYAICDSFNILRSVWNAAIEANITMGIDGEGRMRPNYTIAYLGEPYEVGRPCETTFKVSKPDTEEVIFESDIYWIPEIGTPSNMHRFIFEAFMDALSEPESMAVAQSD